jgi:SAM-dependent methyltransferase
MSWDGAYRTPGMPPPWDIGRPQPEIVRLADAGSFAGSIVDIGCGTGENTLLLAERGLDAWGVDVAPTALGLARGKARLRGLVATFVEGDALGLDMLGRTFDGAIDVGCFHTFDDRDRVRYVASVASVIASGGLLHLLCFSDAQPGTLGPRRISEAEIRAAFSTGWSIEEIRPTAFAARDETFGPDGARAWLAAIRRR